MARKIKQRIELTDEANRLLSHIPESKDMPILPNEQIEEVAEQVRKRLKQKVGQAKAEEWRREFEQIQKTGRVQIGPGLEGVLTEVSKETEQLSFFDLLVDGRKFSGSDADEQALEEYLASSPTETVDVTFLHSGRIPLEPTKRGRGRKLTLQEPTDKKSNTVWYNCTVKVPKKYALAALEDKRMRLEEFARILADSISKQWQEEQTLKLSVFKS